MKSTILTIISIMLVASFAIASCSPVNKAVEYYNTGQKLYVAANVAYANALACQVTANQDIEQQMQLAYQYDWTVLQQNENYRKAMNAPAEAAALAPKTTAQDGSQVIDFSKLPADASPDALYKSGLSFSVYAVQEAQVIPAPPSVTLHAMDAVTVDNNHKFQCFKDWNEAAGNYNTWYLQLPAQVTAQVVDMMKQYFNIAALPESLPMFTGNQVPGQAPNTTNPYAPTAAPAQP